MSKLSREEVARRKKAIYESLSARGRRYIERIGYDKWDPFEEPKDPNGVSITRPSILGSCDYHTLSNRNHATRLGRIGEDVDNHDGSAVGQLRESRVLG